LIVPININTDDITSQYNISTKEMDELIDHVIKDITAAFAAKWEETANRELKSTRSRYVQNLKVIDEGRMQGAVTLDYSKDPLIQMIEEGASSFDMKKNFEKSDKKHIKANGTGWYMSIPFSIGTPGVVESSGFSSVMPSQIYNLIKAKPSSPITNRSQGLSNNEIPKEYSIPKVRAAITIPESQAFAEYKHKSSIFSGVFKQTDSVTGQNSYGSFRRVSDKSDPDSWIYPGMDAKNLAEKAMDSFNTNLQEVLSDSMDSAIEYFGF
jgi:hypothetical protein